MPRTRGQKRMLWVLDTYGENAPLTAMYTWATVGETFRGGYRSLADLFAWTLDQPPWTHGGPTPAAAFGTRTVGQFVEQSLARMRHSIDTFTGWRAEHLSTCAKLIPAAARWVQRELDEGNAGPQLDQIWDQDARTATALPIIPSRRTVDSLYGLSDAFRTLCDWYLAERPDLGRYPTWQSAADDSRAWHAGLRVEAEPKGPRSPVVYEWPDGWTVQRLQTAEAFRYEGAALGHCIALGGMHYFDAHLRRDSRFYSLRTPQNLPWITFQVDSPMQALSSDVGVVAQIQGCKTRLAGVPAPSRDCMPPDPTECTRVFDFLASAGDDWQLGSDYSGCWAYTAAALGLPPEVQARDPSDFHASQLIRPPSHPPVPQGSSTDEFVPRWWEDPDAPLA